MYDLLDGRRECTLREAADGSLHVRAATDVRDDGRVIVREQRSVAVASSGDLAAILLKGLEQRAVGTSSSNDTSSRSHAVLQIEIVNRALLSARDAVLQADALVHPAGRRRDEVMVDLGLNGKLVEYRKDDQGKHFMTATCDTENAELSTEEWFALHARLVAEAEAATAEVAKLSADLKRARAVEQRLVARGPACLCSTVNLVDLAGNDFDKRDLSADHSLQQRKESNHINKDLLAVKECISGIAMKAAKIPFRNSSLTRVLQRALLPPNNEGTTTLMLATVSPDAAAKISTINTLRYAEMVTGRRNEQKARWPTATRSRSGGQKPWKTACDAKSNERQS